MWTQMCPLKPSPKLQVLLFLYIYHCFNRQDDTIGNKCMYQQFEDPLSKGNPVEIIKNWCMWALYLKRVINTLKSSSTGNWVKISSHSSNDILACNRITPEGVMRHCCSVKQGPGMPSLSPIWSIISGTSQWSKDFCNVKNKSVNYG